jgi:class 3 adenylate cyclase
MRGAQLPSGTVTFLFRDIEDSTDLVRRVGNPVFAEIRAHHRRLMRKAFSEHGGHEIDTAGDGFFVAFDSARAGVAAAIEAQLALGAAASSWPEGVNVRVRMGLHTAEPHLAEDGYVGVGVHRAARICDAGRGGQILVSNATAGIVEDAELPGVTLVDLGEHRLKGLHVQQRLFQIAAPGLESTFDPPRTTDSAPGAPGTGTFLFADLAGWRKVIRAVGDEASTSLAADYYAAVSSAGEDHHGVVLELVGDHALSVFPSASDAVRAGAAIRVAMESFQWPDGCDVAVSIALHSGRWSGDPRRPTAATALYRLHTLAQSVEPGQILLSSTTATLIEGDRDVPALRSLGERRIFDEPAPVYELVEAG